MISIGAGIGLAASIAVGSLLEHSVTGMRPAEPSIFAMMLAVLVAAALAASFIPARRASLIDPISALRQD
jgi:ABC-type antimicrobial peptide transport system permease subunit